MAQENHQIRINHPYPPAQARSIRLAAEQLLITDKEQARVEGVAPGSIGDRWAAIASTLRLPYGRRNREHVIVSLFRSRHIEYLAIVAAVLLSVAMLPGGDLYRPARTSRQLTGRHSRERVVAYARPMMGVLQ